MTLHPRVSRAGVLLVKRFEGYRRVAARLAGGGFVVGHGHTLRARQGMEVSEAEAEALLWFDLSRTAEVVEPLLLAPVNGFQFEALTSFAFNIGADAFAGSEVLRTLNEGAYLQAAAAVELWRRAEFDGDARVVDALVRRRAAEKAHFLTPPEGFAPAPTPVLRPRLEPGLARASSREGDVERVVVTAPSTAGEVALAVVADPPGLEGGEPAPSATLAAVDAVSARLASLLGPEAPAPAPPAEAAPVPPAPAEAAEAPEPADPPPFFRRREPEAANDEEPPPPQPDPGAERGPEPEPPPPVRSFAFEPLATPAPSAAVEVAPVERVATAAAVFGHARAFAVLGLVGVALFVGAMLAMLHHPSLFWLFTGLVGVVAIAPSSAFFLFRLAERSPGG